MKEQRWQDWTIVVLGTWLVFSPLVGIGAIGDVAAINSYLTGTAVAIFGIAALARPQMWEEYIALILGFWLIVAPFVLGFTTLGGPVLNQIITGLLVGGIALTVTMQKPTAKAGHA